MAIALNELGHLRIAEQAAALALVGLVITVAVYGVVGLIVKLDDIGIHLAERASPMSKAVGRGLVHVVPKLLTSLSGIGTAAMLWVGGGILLHGIEELGFEQLPHMVHDVGHAIASWFGPLHAIVKWLSNAIAASIRRPDRRRDHRHHRPPIHQASRTICGRRLMHWLLVFLGGGLGAMARHAVGRAGLALLGPGFPWWTLAVNVSGSFVIGLLAGPVFGALELVTMRGCSWSPASSAASPLSPHSASMP